MTMSKRGLETPFAHGLNRLLAQPHTQAVRQYEESLGVQQLRPRLVSSVSAGGKAQSWDQQVLPTLGSALYPGRRHRKGKGYGEVRDLFDCKGRRLRRNRASHVSTALGTEKSRPPKRAAFVFHNSGSYCQINGQYGGLRASL